MPGHLQRILYTAEAVAAGGLDGHGRSPSRPNRPGRATTLAPPGQAHQSPAHPIPREPICQIIERRQRPRADVGGPAKPTRSMRAAGPADRRRRNHTNRRTRAHPPQPDAVRQGTEATTRCGLNSLAPESRPRLGMTTRPRPALTSPRRREDQWSRSPPAMMPSTITSRPCAPGGFRNSGASASLGRWPESMPTASNGIRSPGPCGAAARSAHPAHHPVTTAWT